MISLGELLQLDRVASSIKKIDLFLTDKVKLSDEYMIALAYKVDILHHLGKSNDGLKLILPFINDFKIMSYNAVIAVSDAIINIYLDSKRFDEALKYINLKKNYLPASRMHLYLKDRIKLFLKMDDKKKAKEALEAYIKDDISKEEGIYAKEELSKIYFSEKQYDKYLDLIKSLESYYSENLYLDKLAYLELKRLEIAFDKKNYLKVIADGNKFLENTSRVDYILICAAICIRAYIELEDYKKAGIFESYYEDYATLEHPKEALEFSMAALDLYKRTNSLVSIREYENRCKELSDYLHPQEKKKHTKHKEEELLTADIKPSAIKPAEAFITPNVEILNPAEEIHKERVTITPKPKDIKKALVDSTYNELYSIIDEINNLGYDIKLREAFRQLMIKIKEKLKIEEAYLLYYDKGYRGIYFKSDRAYDYKLEFNDIEDSISYQAIRYNDDLFLDLEDNSYSYDIRGKNYSDFDNAISIPLRDNKEAVASITYFSSEDILATPLLYESLKLIASYIENRLSLSLYIDKLNRSKARLSFIKDNMSSGLLIMEDDYINASKRAMDILGISENIRLNEYLSHLNNEDASRYKGVHEEIYRLMSKDLTIDYDFNNNGKIIRIHERLYEELVDGSLVIYSLIDDITSDYRDREDLIKLAYKNPISNMETEVKLLVDLKEEMPHERLTLAICELSDFNLYKELYGYNFSNQLILALAMGLKEAFSRDFMVSLYHLERDRFAILFKDTNDKRLIDSKLKVAFLKASTSLNKLNKRLNVSFCCGVFRYGRGTRVKDYQDLIKYAHDALYDSLELLGEYPHIAHYNSDITKERLKRNLLVTHISEAIDSNKLSLTYQQVVDLKNQSVYGYNAIINLDNFEVDRAYMDKVIDRRGLRNRIDRYSLNRLFIEERMLYDRLKGYLLMFIKINEKSLDNMLYEYINTLLKHYKIDPSYIVIEALHANNTIVRGLRALGFKIASADIFDVYREDIDYLVYSYHEVGSSSIDEVRELCLKHNVKCILGDINNKDDIKLMKDGGYDLIYGSYYKKLNRIDSIISKIEE